MARHATATSYKKGQSGNPNGKPKGARSLTALLREALIRIDAGNKEPYDELLVKRVMKKAIGDGDPRMIELVWAYIDGRPVTKLEHAGPEGGPIQIAGVDVKLRE